MAVKKFPIVIIVAVSCGFAGSALLNMEQFQHAQADKKLLQGQITDLQYQINQDHSGSSPSPSPADDPGSASPAASADPSPSSSPAVAGTSSVSISELGIRLTAAEPVADLTYGMTSSGSYQVAGLTTESLIAKYAGCKPTATNNGLGQIVRKKPGLSSSGTLVKNLGGYNYFYLPPSGFCATDKDGQNTLAAARAAIKNAVLPTITQ